jgi:hypothetical protein
MEQLATPVESRSDRSERTIQEVGNLGMRETLDIPENDDGPKVIGKSIHRTKNLVADQVLNTVDSASFRCAATGRFIDGFVISQ